MVARLLTKLGKTTPSIIYDLLVGLLSGTYNNKFLIVPFCLSKKAFFVGGANYGRSNIDKLSTLIAYLNTQVTVSRYRLL